MILPGRTGACSFDTRMPAGKNSFQIATARLKADTHITSRSSRRTRLRGRRVPYNLDSPNGLLDPIDTTNTARWLVNESLQIESEEIRHVAQYVAGNLKSFIYWPDRAVLLWQGCDRIKPDGKKQKY